MNVKVPNNSEFHSFEMGTFTLGKYILALPTGLLKVYIRIAIFNFDICKVWNVFINFVVEIS